MKRITILLAILLLISTFAACGAANNGSTNTDDGPSQTQAPASSDFSSSEADTTPEQVDSSETEVEEQDMDILIPENFVLITGDAFVMGSPDSGTRRVYRGGGSGWERQL